MVKVRLEVRGGGLVGWANVPAMAPMPEIVIFGQRFFMRDGSADGLHPVYREALAWPVDDVKGNADEKE